MDCFLVGETLKYFYIIFRGPEFISMDEFVLIPKRTRCDGFGRDDSRVA